MLHSETLKKPDPVQPKPNSIAQFENKSLPEEVEGKNPLVYKPKHEDFSTLSENQLLPPSDNNYYEERHEQRLSRDLMPFCLSPDLSSTYYHKKNPTRYAKIGYDFDLFPEYDFCIKLEALSVASM